MTVVTQTSKTDPQVMGAYIYDFGFERLSQDPTAEDAKKAIKVAISDGTTETILEYGKDYSVDFGTSGIGGTVTVKDPKDSSWTLIVYREYNMTQGSEYRDYNAFPAPTLESNMDKTLMLLQQVQEQVNRSVKVNMTSSVDPDTIVGYVERINQSIDNIDIIAENADGLDDIANNIDVVLAAPHHAQNAADSAASASASEASAATSKDTALTAATSAEHYAEVTQQYAINAAYGNVGDIKYTARKNVPAGGKWCDGTQYAATDTDCARIYQMLVDGDLESVSFTVFDQTVTDSGSCGFFGLDTETQSFKVPKLNDIYLKAGNTPLMFGGQSLPNIKGELYSINMTGEIESDGCLYQTELSDAGIRNDAGQLKGSKLHVDASKSSAVYKNNADVNPEHVTYRAYVVIYASELDIDVAEAEAARDAAIAAKNEAAASATAASGSATQAAASATAAAQSAEEAQNQVLPDQTGQDGKYLTTNNGTPAWGALDLNSKADTDLENITATGKANILALKKLDWANRVQILTNNGSTGIEQGYTPPSSGVLQHFTRASGSRAMGIYKGNAISNDKVLYYFRSDDSSISFYYGLIEVEGGEPYWLQGNPNSEEICFIPYLGA